MNHPESPSFPHPMCDPKRTATSFYSTLGSEGFTPEQVVSLTTELLDLVATELEHAPQEASLP
jgi:hypothetical protein